MPVPSSLYKSLNVSTIVPDAVLFLGSPLVSAYEIDLYLSLWNRLHHGGGSGNSNGNMGKRKPVPFVCADGSWSRLVGVHRGSVECSQRYPFHVSCGDMDSQLPIPSSPSADPYPTIPRVPAPTVAELTTEQLAQIHSHVAGKGGDSPYVLVPITNDQNSTDFDKCLELSRRLLSECPVPYSSDSPPSNEGEGGADEGPPSSSDGDTKPLPLVLVLGALGGRFDHSMAVISSIIGARDKLRVVVHSAGNTIFCCARNGMTEFHHSSVVDGPSCGVMVFGEATSSVVTTGLKWNLGDPSLVTGFLGTCLSTSNIILPPEYPVITSSQDGAQSGGAADSVKEEGEPRSVVTIDTSSIPDEGRRSAVIFSVERQM